MLKSNSKKASDNIRRYIIDHSDLSAIGLPDPDTFSGYAAAILDTFRAEKAPIGAYADMSETERFIDWCSGLPSILDTCYYYNRSAVDDLGAILEETEKEKARFSESQAERMLSSLIYRELKKTEKRR